MPSLWAIATLEAKIPNFFLPVSQFCCWAWCCRVWSILSSAQLSQLCPLPASCSPSACCWGGERGSRIGKGGNLGAVQALFSQMPVCYQHSQPPAQHTVPYGLIEVNSIPTRPSTSPFTDLRMERIVAVSSTITYDSHWHWLWSYSLEWKNSPAFTSNLIHSLSEKRET